MSSPRSRLDDRYGVSNSASRERLRKIAIAVLSAVFVATVLWVAWVFISGNQVKASTVGYHHLSPSQIAVDFSVTMAPGTAATCSVEAYNQNRGQVGFIEVDIAPQTERITTHRAVITTQQAAVSGAVKRCSAAG